MPNYRRYFVQGGSFFFTLVTANRMPIFREEPACRLLGSCLRAEREKRSFRTEAIVLLPDHLHTIWSLPAGDASYSIRWAAIKASFTRLWLESGGMEQEVTPGRRRELRRGVWQARFIEHTIRDEDDWENHVQYIHYNPVKHSMVSCPQEWPWSSFHRYARQGWYPIDWGCAHHDPPKKLKAVREDLLE